MRNLFAMQRQIQDLMQMIHNMERVGKVSKVKFDEEKKRWFVKFTSGEGDEAINTDWVPWKSFAHASIQASIPPAEGQVVSLRSVGGQMEMAHCEPYHYSPDDKSPHDKENEVKFRFNLPKKKKSEGQDGQSGETSSAAAAKEEEEDPDQIFTMLFTKDGLTFEIGKSKFTMGAKGFKATHDKNTWEMTPEGIKSSVEDGKSVIDMTKDKVESKSDTVKAKSTDGSGSVTVTDAGVDTQGKKINDG